MSQKEKKLAEECNKGITDSCEVLREIIDAKREGYFVAPSYGRVLRANEEKISIFIPFRANHKLFSPTTGEIKSIRGEKGEFKKEFFEAEFLKKGKVRICFDGTKGDVCFSSYVGFPFRPERIRIDKEEGKVITQGEEIGEILLGSLTELELPEGIKVTPIVSIGDKVKGGKTRIARWELKEVERLKL